MKYVQAAVRRNGLHAIRGWCLDVLNICPGYTTETGGTERGGINWFASTVKRRTLDEVLEASADEPFVTLESQELPFVLKFAKRSGRHLILHYRSLTNWLASSIRLTKDRDGDANLQMHRECIMIWQSYLRAVNGLRLPATAVWIDYDRWHSSSKYRITLAQHMLVDHYDGHPYVRVHGPEYSSFDGRAYDGRANRMDVRHRERQMKYDEDYLYLLEYARSEGARV